MSSLAALQLRDDQQFFLERVAPLVARWGRWAFRFLERPDRIEDALQDALCDAWAACLSLSRRGRLLEVQPSAIARFALRRIRCGRRPQGRGPVADRAREVYDWRAQQRHGFTVCPLPPEEYNDRPHHNRQSSIPTQAAFRIDFRCWFRGRSLRERRAIAALARGEKPYHAARRLGVSPCWFNKARVRWSRSWSRFMRR